MSAHLVLSGIALVVIVTCILVHYEVMRLCSSWPLLTNPRSPRRRVTLVIGALMLAHVIEVWIFAFTYFAILHGTALDGDLTGGMTGTLTESLLDCVYFSVVCFTTLGYGDIVPTGSLRILAGAEALAGLSLVTWSASFTFLHMQRHWKEASTP